VTLDELNSYRDKLIAAMSGGTRQVSTPQLGLVEFSSPSEIQSAIAWIDAQTALVNGTARTFIFQSNRGTGL
jgi:hypothetical protein